MTYLACTLRSMTQMAIFQCYFQYLFSWGVFLEAFKLISSISFVFFNTKNHDDAKFLL